MTITRLSSVLPELARNLEGQPPVAQRLAAVAAARLACRATSLDDPTIERLLEELLNGVVDPAKRTAVKSRAELLDEAAWDIQDRVESGAADHSEYLSQFSQARAAWAAYFAALDDTVEGSSEAIYEASAAFDEPGAIEDAVRDAWRSRGS